MNRILAVSIGGLGDAILFSPTLKALRNTYHEAHIELLVANRLAYEAYSYAKEVSHISFINTKYSFFLLKAASVIPFIVNARKNGQFDIGYFATGLNTNLGHLMKKAGIIENFTFAPCVPNFPTDFDCNLQLARFVNNSISEKDVFMPITREADLEAKTILKKHNISFEDESLIAVYPSSEYFHRPRWEISNLMKVIELIKNDCFNSKTVIVGSQQEGDEWAAIDKYHIADANFAGKLSILGSAALLNKSSLTIGNDGGLMHVAGAVGCPLVVIMPNTPLSYRPPGKNVKIIKSKHSCCNGLYPNRPRRCKIAKCTEDITVKEVVNACREILKGNNTELKSSIGAFGRNMKLF